MFKVLLNSCEVGVPRSLEICESIEECQSKVLAYISEYQLGSSQWLGGQLFDEDGEYLGNISYNGRYWLNYSE